MMCLLKLSSIPEILLWGQKSKPIRLPMGETRKGTIGLLVDPEENFDRLDSFSFTTDDIADGESHELLVEGTSFEIPLKGK